MGGPLVVAPTVAGFGQAFACTTVAPSAIAADTKLVAQVFQRAGTAGGGFADVTVGYSLANANVHDYPAKWIKCERFLFYRSERGRQGFFQALRRLEPH
jgi:hypothetical protein